LLIEIIHRYARYGAPLRPRVMTTFYQSLPRDAKSPSFVVRLAVDGIRMFFFREVYRKTNVGALGCIIA
jgi:hypothetical protein